MNLMKKTFSFNRFSINKEVFFKIIDSAMEFDEEIRSLFILYPCPYDRIYVTMTDKELIALGKRRNIDNIINFFEEFDAMFSSAEACIIIHVPAMIKKIRHIPSRNDDQKRHILFTIHFFACLFHEHSHANEHSRYLMRVVSDSLSGKEISIMKSLDEKERIAENGKKLYIGCFCTTRQIGGLTLCQPFKDQKLSHAGFATELIHV